MLGCCLYYEFVFYIYILFTLHYLILRDIWGIGYNIQRYKIKKHLISQIKSNMHGYTRVRKFIFYINSVWIITIYIKIQHYSKRNRISIIDNNASIIFYINILFRIHLRIRHTRVKEFERKCNFIRAEVYNDGPVFRPKGRAERSGLQAALR